MTYEAFDDFLTLALSGILYGTALWLVIAFPLFVATRNLSGHSEGQRLQQASEQHSQASDQTATAPPTYKTIQPHPIATVPVDFSQWSVADLRWSRLRAAFDIPVRPTGNSKAFRKAELVALYTAAIGQRQATTQLVSG